MRYRINCLVRKTDSIDDETHNHADEVLETENALDALIEWLNNKDSWIHATVDQVVDAMTIQLGGKIPEPNDFTLEILCEGQDWHGDVEYGPNSATLEGRSLGEFNFRVTAKEEITLSREEIAHDYKSNS